MHSLCHCCSLIVSVVYVMFIFDRFSIQYKRHTRYLFIYLFIVDLILFLHFAFKWMTFGEVRNVFYS